jgi:hypothetical protein
MTWSSVEVVKGQWQGGLDTCGSSGATPAQLHSGIDHYGFAGMLHWSTCWLVNGSLPVKLPHLLGVLAFCCREMVEYIVLALAYSTR